MCPSTLPLSWAITGFMATAAFAQATNTPVSRRMGAGPCS